MRVVVSGGGTGGHIFPALAVIEALERADPSGERLYIGGSTGMETQIVPQAGVPFQAVTAKKLRKLISPGTIGVALSLFKGYREARTYLKAFRAEAVVGTGGYVAGAAMLAGVTLGLPTLILAPDLIPGRTNRLLARFAKKVCVVFPETVPVLGAAKSVVTGLPLRFGIVLPPTTTPQQARCSFEGLRPDAFTVLVAGGSQGARAVNNLVLGAAPDLLAAGVQILHQTGPKNFDEVTQQAKAQGLTAEKGYLPLAFFDATRMPLALRAADLFVCRGGISTLSEAMANALPAMVIPLPSAYADHQTANARALETAGAGLHRAENSLTASKLSAEILELRAAPERLVAMSQASRALGKADAADAVAKLILSLRVETY
ncbi:MAG: UDP-N-acetylglucosamine-N-acetylmuramylpentapeptide N-acetylglucosamine transferase [Chthonomonadaceae bacterium]|nr:UDP-N-acetylglucosamine-N-acetylmuramylpentapeptide N-acetylglucosamine transferase [Chthonomonadaceae bacterium]